MLKYKINNTLPIGEYIEFTPTSYSLSDLPGTEKYVCTINHDGSAKISRGENVTLSYTNYNDNSVRYESVYSNVLEKYEVVTSDENANIFTVHVPKKYPLYVDTITPIYNGSYPSISIRFKRQHYFKKDDECVITVTSDNASFDVKCVFVDNYTLRWDYDETVENAFLFPDLIFHKAFYNVSNSDCEEGCVVVNDIPENVVYSSYPRIKVLGTGGQYFIFDRSLGSAEIPSTPFYRDCFIFDRNGILTVRKTTSTASIQIPIFQKFDTDTDREEVLIEKTLQDETDLFFNKSMSLEKDVYVPAVIDENGIPNMVRHINFNLHFRKHDLNNNWKVDEDSFWVGTNDSDLNNLVLSQNRYWDYENDTMSSIIDTRSDLLYELGFSDADVRYRKSRLCMSFLRLMYYDSPNPITQRLLGYYTIFFDCGKLQSKKMMHSTEQNYYITHDDNEQRFNVTQGSLDMGIAVNKEPWAISGLGDEELEALRLSSRFTVSDRMLSASSSDGFYLHLYESFSSPLPKRIYLKVDFNHAGYGRTVSMMMPSFIYDMDLRKGVKSYSEILEDWSGDDSGYGFKAYNAYSYIVMAYRYDYDLKRHIYYPDLEYYGEWNNYDSDKHILNFNLYESKVRL